MRGFRGNNFIMLKPPSDRFSFCFLHRLDIDIDFIIVIDLVLVVVTPVLLRLFFYSSACSSPLYAPVCVASRLF